VQKQTPSSVEACRTEPPAIRIAHLVKSESDLVEELIVVRRFRDLIEAELAKGKLESAGIDSFVADENIVRMDWFYSNAVGGLRLMVKPEDADAAVTILDEPIPDQLTQEDPDLTYTQPHCPKCDSLDVSFETLDRPLSYGLMYLNLPFPVSKHNWKCQKCGAEWIEE
jgi:hypothetical protein